MRKINRTSLGEDSLVGNCAINDLRIFIAVEVSLRAKRHLHFITVATDFSVEQEDKFMISLQ